MPLPTVDCAIPDSACCTSLYDIADHLLVNVHEALLTCYLASPCPLDALLAYVTMGSGDDGVTDSLIVAFGQVAPSPATVARGVNLALGLQRASFQVILRESGWPMSHTEGSQIVAPDPIAQNALARHAYAHGEKMYRHLLHMNAQRNMTPITVRGCANTLISPLTPMNPSGGTIGFRVAVTIDLPWGA